MYGLSLDLAKNSVAQWVRVHGGESLDQQCERFTGYYEQWVGTGTEKGIIGYTSAHLAYLKSQIYDTNPNGGQPGDVGFWDAPPFGHVGRWMGKDSGRTLVSYATRLGDTVVDIGSGVKVGHADSYPHRFLGWARAHNGNTRIDVSPWDITPTAPAGGTGGIDWNAAAGDKLRLVNSGEGYQYWEPYGGPLAGTLMQALKDRGRIGVSNFVVDRDPGKETRKGIQRTLSITGIFKGSIDGVIALGGCHGIQTYGSRARNHPYTGRNDGVPQQRSWVGFVNFLHED